MIIALKHLFTIAKGTSDTIGIKLKMTHTHMFYSRNVDLKHVRHWRDQDIQLWPFKRIIIGKIEFDHTFNIGSRLLA